ncbi:Inward rectifier potassium channel irk-1 [Blastocystis sp. ATCC 50177/Nand II]|uniref:Inward rectifier potassium channel irk-1 n=1 Tax=Blastocystis sp. subtype 1 (strain ATCC 50177 / NandII) TaxID=478820 RepID=A0A196SFT8_BLAHN|nr:Inward rectifier potassium channel irk-1 [Blastocystis sp. ATCC 50177/Nand II]
MADIEVSDMNYSMLFKSNDEGRVDVAGWFLVVNNFVDMKQEWFFSEETMKRRCVEIVERSNKGFEFWNLNSCLYQRFGMKELYLVITQPVFQIKMRCLKEMMINALHDMEGSRSGVEGVLQKQDYSAFIKRQIERKQQANADQKNSESARDFNTLHSFYLHDHTLNPHSIIHSTSNEKGYATLTEGKLPKTADRHALESGSDCDDVSPVDAANPYRQAVKIDPKVLTESLADFFEDIADDDAVGERISKSVESIPITTGASKEEEETRTHEAELRLDAYPVPANAKKVTEKEEVELSDSDMMEDEGLVATAVKYSRFNIKRIGENSSYIYLEDWFHTLSSQSTGKVVIFILLFYLVSVLFWATLFYIFRDYGFVDISTYVAAMIISLETITTVGYSVTDINFGDHPIAFFLLYGEMMQSILMNSFCIGIVYTRLSRAITRSRSIICSDKAVIRRIDGKWCFVFQICEMRKHQLIESHVTCYCVQKTVNKSSGVPFQMSRMTLSHPKESRSGYTVMMLPAVIVHPIEEDSPLYPALAVFSDLSTPSEDLSTASSRRLSRCFTTSHLDPGRRSVANLSDLERVWPCPVCGEVYLTKQLLEAHAEREHLREESVSEDSVEGMVEENQRRPSRTSRLSRASHTSRASSPLKPVPELTYQLIMDHIRKNDLEVIVLIEGTESVTSSKLQARFSYAVTDIEVNRTFGPCVTAGKDGEAVIDFEKFHKTVPIDPNNAAQESLFLQSVL